MFGFRKIEHWTLLNPSLHTQFCSFIPSMKLWSPWSDFNLSRQHFNRLWLARQLKYHTWSCCRIKHKIRLQFHFQGNLKSGCGLNIECYICRIWPSFPWLLKFKITSKWTIILKLFDGKCDGKYVARLYSPMYRYLIYNFRLPLTMPTAAIPSEIGISQIKDTGTFQDYHRFLLHLNCWISHYESGCLLSKTKVR
jgi:hypothetical protein